MNKDQTKEIETSLIMISGICEKIPTIYRNAAFEFLLKKLPIQSSTANALDHDNKVDEFDKKKQLLKLAEKCGVNVNELEKIIVVKDKNLEIHSSLTDSKSFQQIAGSMIVLLCRNVIFSEREIASDKILPVLDGMGIEDKGRNFAGNLKKCKHLILKKSKNDKYRLVGDGEKIAVRLLTKLTKSEHIDKKDLGLK